jgi:hypothetical protein
MPVSVHFQSSQCQCLLASNPVSASVCSLPIQSVPVSVHFQSSQCQCLFTSCLCYVHFLSLLHSTLYRLLVASPNRAEGTGAHRLSAYGCYDNSDARFMHSASWMQTGGLVQPPPPADMDTIWFIDLLPWRHQAPSDF